MNAIRQRSQGFTLIELLVVIAIIAILAAILFPVFAQAKDAAKKTQDLSNLKNISTAALLYAGDYDDTMPWVLWPEWYTNAVRFLPYVKNKDVFKSPKSPYKKGAYNTKQAGNGYGFYMNDPNTDCSGNLGVSARGADNWYDDIYFPLDYQWNESINSGSNAAQCMGAWWAGGGSAGVDGGMSTTAGKVVNVSKVVMWSTFPSIGNEWPGGCVDGNCQNVDASDSHASFWGTNFKGYFAQGSNLVHLDSHAKYYKVQAIHPCGTENCYEPEPARDATNWFRTDFKAWGFDWAHSKVQ